MPLPVSSGYILVIDPRKQRRRSMSFALSSPALPPASGNTCDLSACTPPWLGGSQVRQAHSWGPGPHAASSLHPEIMRKLLTPLSFLCPRSSSYFLVSQWLNLPHLLLSFFIFFSFYLSNFFFVCGKGFELGTLPLLGRCFTAWAIFLQF
jgi:hypothetical protein